MSIGVSVICPYCKLLVGDVDQRRVDMHVMLCNTDFSEIPTPAVAAATGTEGFEWHTTVPKGPNQARIAAMLHKMIDMPLVNIATVMGGTADDAIRTCVHEDTVGGIKPRKRILLQCVTRMNDGTLAIKFTEEKTADLPTVTENLCFCSVFAEI